MRSDFNARSRARRGVFALLGVVTLGAGLSGCIGYDGDFDRGYQIDEQSLEKVKVGATSKQEALALMGTPSTTSTIGGITWKTPRT